MARPTRDLAADLGFDPTEEEKAQLRLENKELQEQKTPIYEEAVVQAAARNEQIEESAKRSMDFLAGLVMPAVFKYLFPPVFKSIWFWLLSFVHKTRDFSQLAIGLPRGFGKTMVVKLFLFYTVVFTKKQFILVIAGTQTKANNIISDVMKMLDEPNVKKVFGDWKAGAETDRQDMKKFSFRGRIIMVAGAGAGSDIRGITLENVRPDVMIFDDIQTREEADSPQVSNNLEQWMYGTAMKAKSPEGCLFIFIANMYPTEWSLLRRIKSNPNWVKFIAGGILADGTSLWEDLQPISQLLREFQNDLSTGRPEIFYAEVLNDEHASMNNFLDISKLPINPHRKDDIHQGNCVIIDPATDKVGSDAVSVGYFEYYDNRPVARRIVEGRLSPGDTAQEAIKMCLANRCYLIVVEANAYQYVLKWIIEQELIRYGIIGVNVVPIYSGGKSKNSRILNMFKELLKGETFLDDDCKLQVTAQVVGFNPMKTNNTDGILDLLTYAPRIPQEFGEFMIQSTVLEMQEAGAIEIPTEQETCPF